MSVQPHRTDPDRERLGRVGVAVGDEYPLRPTIAAVRAARLREVAEPVVELVLIGVGGEAGDDSDTALISVRDAVDLRDLGARLDVPSERSLTLVADEQEGAGGIGQEVLEVVHDPPAGEHPGARHEHQRPWLGPDPLGLRRLRWCTSRRDT